MEKCCICGCELTAENPPVLSFGHYGNPRCLCDDCAASLDTITLGRDYAQIKEAMEKVTAAYDAIGADDPVVTEALDDIYTKAQTRAEKIADGSYDFEEDVLATEEESEETLEVPKELAETEEDRQLDLIEAEAQKKSDKIMNIVTGVTLLAVIGFLVYFFFFRG